MINPLEKLLLPTGTEGMVHFSAKNGDVLVFFTDEGSPEQLRGVQRGFAQKGIDVIVMLLPTDADVALLKPDQQDAIYAALGKLIQSRQRIITP